MDRNDNPNIVTNVQITAVITRADGTVEDLGVISEPGPHIVVELSEENK